MATPWYTSPEALRILASIRANPPRLEARSDTHVLTRDDWACYVGERVDRLNAIHDDELRRLDAMQPWPEGLVRELLLTTVDDVIAAVLGVTLPGVHFLSDFPRLAAIRAAVDAALAMKVAA